MGCAIRKIQLTEPKVVPDIIPRKAELTNLEALGNMYTGENILVTDIVPLKQAFLGQVLVVHRNVRGVLHHIHTGNIVSVAEADFRGSEEEGFLSCHIAHDHFIQLILIGRLGGFPVFIRQVGGGQTFVKSSAHQTQQVCLHTEQIFHTQQRTVVEIKVHIAVGIVIGLVPRKQADAQHIGVIGIYGVGRIPNGGALVRKMLLQGLCFRSNGSVHRRLHVLIYQAADLGIGKRSVLPKGLGNFRILQMVLVIKAIQVDARLGNDFLVLPVNLGRKQRLTVGALNQHIGRPHRQQGKHQQQRYVFQSFFHKPRLLYFPPSLYTHAITASTDEFIKQIQLANWISQHLFTIHSYLLPNYKTHLIHVDEVGFELFLYLDYLLFT